MAGLHKLRAPGAATGRAAGVGLVNRGNAERLEEPLGTIASASPRPGG